MRRYTWQYSARDALRFNGTSALVAMTEFSGSTHEVRERPTAFHIRSIDAFYIRRDLMLSVIDALLSLTKLFRFWILRVYFLCTLSVQAAIAPRRTLVYSCSPKINRSTNQPDLRRAGHSLLVLAKQRRVRRHAESERGRPVLCTAAGGRCTALCLARG